MDNKEPFTDERIGSLLATVIKSLLNSNEVNFKEGSDYKWTLTFSVKDEHLIILENNLGRILVDE